MGVNSGCGFIFGSLYHLISTEIIKKCGRYFITKCDKNLLQNASGFLLQNLVVITKCDGFIARCESYHKMRRLFTKCVGTTFPKFIWQ